MPDASPTKWHLGYTTWFFETFFLSPIPTHLAFDAAFAYLFNSYYEALGPRQPRAQRGLLTRPALSEALDYRQHVDAAIDRFSSQTVPSDVAERLKLGLAHEEQHQ